MEHLLQGFNGVDAPATKRDVMTFYRETNRNLYILTVNQAKAFDRVEHNFLHVA
jgi:hypothetical protein